MVVAPSTFRTENLGNQSNTFCLKRYIVLLSRNMENPKKKKKKKKIRKN